MRIITDQDELITKWVGKYTILHDGFVPNLLDDDGHRVKRAVPVYDKNITKSGFEWIENECSRIGATGIDCYIVQYDAVSNLIALAVKKKEK
jgi:hypothetical protein